MPNWCQNKLILKGDSDAIRQVNHAFTTAEYLFGIFITHTEGPFQKLIGRDDTYTDENWYEHNMTRYGTKWDIEPIETDYVDGDTQLCLYFSTAWSPPSAFVETLCEKFKLEATHTFSEAGCDFAGRDVYTWIDDKLIIENEVWRHEEGLYLMDREYWMESRLEELIEFAEEDEMQTAEDFFSSYTFLSDDDRRICIETYKEVYPQSEIS